MWMFRRPFGEEIEDSTTFSLQQLTHLTQHDVDIFYCVSPLPSPPRDSRPTLTSPLSREFQAQPPVGMPDAVSSRLPLDLWLSFHKTRVMRLGWRKAPPSLEGIDPLSLLQPGPSGPASLGNDLAAPQMPWLTAFLGNDCIPKFVYSSSCTLIRSASRNVIPPEPKPTLVAAVLALELVQAQATLEPRAEPAPAEQEEDEAESDAETEQLVSAPLQSHRLGKITRAQRRKQSRRKKWEQAQQAVLGQVVDLRVREATLPSLAQHTAVLSRNTLTKMMGDSVWCVQILV
jgi:hypothetical protein